MQSLDDKTVVVAGGTGEDSPVQVVELVTHAFIRNRRTQPGSPIPGEAVGAYAAYLLSGAGNAHGQSLQLRSLEQLEQVGIDLARAKPQAKR